MIENAIFYGTAVIFSLFVMIEGIYNEASLARCIKAITFCIACYLIINIITYKSENQSFFVHLANGFNILNIAIDSSITTARGVKIHFFLTLIFVSHLLLLLYILKGVKSKKISHNKSSNSNAVNSAGS